MDTVMVAVEDTAMDIAMVAEERRMERTDIITCRLMRKITSTTPLESWPSRVTTLLRNLRHHRPNRMKARQ